MLMFALDDISIHALGCSNGCILVQAQVIRRGQQLKAKLDWDIHVGDIFAIAVAIPVVKVFDNLIEDHGAVDIFYHQRLALSRVGMFQQRPSTTRLGASVVRSSVVSTHVAQPRSLGCSLNKAS
ncbi:hypothetical protein SNK05_000392 [Fusarium graminearum]